MYTCKKHGWRHMSDKCPDCWENRVIVFDGKFNPSAISHYDDKEYDRGYANGHMDAIKELWAAWPSEKESCLVECSEQYKWHLDDHLRGWEDACDWLKEYLKQKLEDNE